MIKTEKLLLAEYNKNEEKIKSYLYFYGNSDSEIERSKIEYKKEINSLYKKGNDIWADLLELTKNRI